ncbi:MAG: alpha-2-macroglobulin family protein [Desulfococcaceae bacterium]
MARTVLILLSFLLTLSGPSDALPEEAAAPNPPSESFRVLDIGERTFDNGPAIAVLLSKPLDPAVRHDSHIRISDTRELLKSAWVLSEDRRTLYFPHVEPETQYSVSVMESLPSADGQTLGERVSETVTTRTLHPIVSFASEGFLLPAELAGGLPVVTVNVRSVYIEFFRIDTGGLINLVSWRNTTGEKGYYHLSQAKDHGKLVFSGRFELDVENNRRTVYHIPVENIPPLQEPGVYLAVMREPGQYAYNYQSTYFLVTDIGLHARAYDTESLVFASSLRTGAPLEGVDLTVYNSKTEVIAEGVTDAQGRYRLDLTLPGDVYLITAARNDQTGILPLRMPALDMSAFDLGKRPYRAREFFIYSPRDLYRPGETVVLSGLLRNEDGFPVDPIPLKTALYRPDGREVRSFTWHALKLGAEGLVYYQESVDLPSDAQTGKWQVKVWDDPADEAPAVVYPFHVEEFLPERMKLELDLRPEFPGPREPLQLKISGRYLYGAPAAGNEVIARVRVKADRNPFSEWEGYTFGRAADEDYQDYRELSPETLDPEGETTIQIESRWKELESPLSVRTAVDLLETGGRPVTRAAQRTIWPGDALVGIRPLFDDGSTESGPVRFEVIRVSPDGKPRGDGELLVELTKEDRDYYWEYSESTGWQYKYTRKDYQFLADSLSLGGDQPHSYTLQLQDGQYLLAITDPETGLTTSVRFRVGSWWYGGEGADAARPDKVVLGLDREAYRPGDIIRLTVTPPHSGEALILVEGEKPLWMKRISVTEGAALVEIPILAGWDSHNLHISAVVFRPGDAKEKITPNRAVGLIHLPMDRSRRKMKVDIEAPEEVNPENPLPVTLQLDPGTTDLDEPLFVTLAAVDVGILNITDFQTPDPFDYFFGRRRYAVDAYDIYGKVIELMDGNMAALRYGGDADLTGGKRPETKIDLLSLFQGPVAFDPEGKARIFFDLPDFNGRIRLMAVAFGRDRFGSAEQEVRVAAPVVSQLSTPRFLAPGDTARFTLDLHNLSGSDQQLEVRLGVDGPILLKDGDRSLSLAEGEKTSLRFPVAARADYGAADIRLQVAGEGIRPGEGIRIDRKWQLGVRPGYPATARKVFEILGPEESFSLDPGLAADLIPETVDGDLKISTRAPINFQNAMKGLINFPYGCLEQVSSRAYPLLFATPEQIARHNLPSITREERLKRLRSAVDRLAAMQLASGGFGLWNKSSPESPWLTVYVTDFLLTARDRGVEIPPAMTDSALTRIEDYLKRAAPLPDYMDNTDRESLQFAVKSYAGYVLARLNRAPLGSLRTLYDNHRDQAVSPLPLTHLGIALEWMGDMNRSEAALNSAVKMRPESDRYRADYGTSLRDLALTVSLLVENEKQSLKGMDALLADLGTALRQRRWLSTQEKYALFSAGMALAESEDTPWSGTLKASGNDIQLNERGSYSTNLSEGEIVRGVSFESRSSDRLYVSAIVDGYSKTPPEPEDEQIAVSRDLFDLDGNRVERDRFYVGELILVRLKIAAKQYIPDGLVVDMLPAGFEAENPNLNHTFKMEDLEIEGESIWRQKEGADIRHEAYREDRYVAAVRLNDHSVTHLFYLIRAVTPGSFSVPPPFAEAMYRPEVRGIGKTPPPVTVVNRNREAKKADSAESGKEKPEIEAQ